MEAQPVAAASPSRRIALCLCPGGHRSISGVGDGPCVTISRMVQRPDLKNEPYCSNCGYRLTGLTESSKCPECGRPLVEVLTRNPTLNFGKRWQSRVRILGWPAIDIAFGPHGGEMRGKARGIIAIGDIATGGLAMGGIARGVVAIGGLAVGVCAVGGMAIGVLTACGGMAIGGIATGGGAIGIVATGGGAAGVIAQGGEAFGIYARNHRSINSPAAREVFATLSWLMGPWPARGLETLVPVFANAALTAFTAAVVAVPALILVIRDNWEKQHAGDAEA